MKHSPKPAISLILFFITVAFSLNAGAQNKIKLPVYTITLDALKSMFVKGKDSKIITNINIENASVDLNKGTSLNLFAFSAKEKKGDGSDAYEKYKKGGVFHETFDTAFIEFSIGNNEIKIKTLEKLLPDQKLMANDTLYLVPSFVGTTIGNQQMYTLIYVLKYLDKNALIESSENIQDQKQNLGGSNHESKPVPALLKSLTTITALNPCPPAKPRA